MSGAISPGMTYLDETTLRPIDLPALLRRHDRLDMGVLLNNGTRTPVRLVPPPSLLRAPTPGVARPESRGGGPSALSAGCGANLVLGMTVLAGGFWADFGIARDRDRMEDCRGQGKADMTWYYAKNGVQMGPVPLGELEAAIRTGELTPTDLVWREGMADWQPCGPVAEFAPLLVRREHAPPVLAGSPARVPAPRPIPTQPIRTVPNYLWQAIVVTILCCWPVGSPAIVFAAKVDDLAARGDVAGAVAASNSARTWCWVAFFVGLLPAALGLLWFVFVVVMAGASLSAA